MQSLLIHFFIIGKILVSCVKKFFSWNEAENWYSFKTFPM